MNMESLKEKLKGLLQQQLTMKAKIIIALLVLGMALIGALVSYQFYDFTQNNPKFCVSCHLMQPSYDAWDKSAHKGINCHDCHHLSIPEANMLLVSFVLHRPEHVPNRHGKVIVSWKHCTKCHWESDEKAPNAPKINDSTMHSKHYFTEQIECSKCHGYINDKNEGVHLFKPDGRFCVKCHTEKKVHGAGMEEISCLNCHTDRTKDLFPDRAKCLQCHGDEKYKKELQAGKTMDTEIPVDEGLMMGARKIDADPTAPMQFRCNECHNPHKGARPTAESCVRCHTDIKSRGKHTLHVEGMGMDCAQCHKAHTWKMTEKIAQKACTSCHGYRSYRGFAQ